MSYTEKMRKSHNKNPPTRRDYELIAWVISRLTQPPSKAAWIARAFADELRRMPGFNEARFLKACGLKEK
jgi:hypothetical protein